MKALILVDIQNDFVPGGNLAVDEGDKIIPFVNELQKQFDLIVATQDFHPEDHGSFAANHDGRKIGEQIDLHGLPQVLWPIHCIQGSEGADFVENLDMSKVDKVFPKGTDRTIDSYSGFYDNGHRKSTGMAEYLKEKGVNEVHVVGLAADFCVKFTALDALKEGFKTVLHREGTRGVNLQPGDTEKAFVELEAAGVVIK